MNDKNNIISQFKAISEGYQALLRSKDSLVQQLKVKTSFPSAINDYYNLLEDYISQLKNLKSKLSKYKNQ